MGKSTDVYYLCFTADSAPFSDNNTVVKKRLVPTLVTFIGVDTYVGRKSTNLDQLGGVRLPCRLCAYSSTGFLRYTLDL